MKASRKVPPDLVDQIQKLGPLILDHLQSAIRVERPDGSVVFCNRTFLDLSHDESSEQHLLKNLPSNVAFESSLRIIKSQRVPIAKEEITLTNDSVLERDFVPIGNGETPVLDIWIYRDITELKRSQKTIEEQRLQLVESLKLKALGEMAGGVAHEINNPLTVLMGRLRLLEKKVAQKELTAELVSRTCAECLLVVDRLNKIVKGLRLISGGDSSYSHENVMVSDLVGMTLDISRAKLRDCSIELRLNLDDPTLRVSCRPVQISQVILNLLNNACDAIEHHSERWIEIASHKDGQSLVLTVTDSGKGIPLETRTRMFNPFFTTKTGSKGTGLGLSVSKRIAEDHGGQLYFNENHPHTQLVLTLPLTLGA